MVNIFFNYLEDGSDHCDLGNSYVCVWIISIDLVVHPDFTDTLTVKSDILIWDGERFLDDGTGKEMESLQALRVHVQSIRERDVSKIEQGQGNTFDKDFA